MYSKAKCEPLLRGKKHHQERSKEESFSFWWEKKWSFHGRGMVGVTRNQKRLGRGKKSQVPDRRAAFNRWRGISYLWTCERSHTRIQRCVYLQAHVCVCSGLQNQDGARGRTCTGELCLTRTHLPGPNSHGVSNWLSQDLSSHSYSFNQLLTFFCSEH